MTTDLTAKTTLLAEARATYAQIVEVESAIRRDYDLLLAAGWALGQKLVALKDEIGHGKWLFWLGQNWSDLGERRAQNCMAFFRDNEALANPQNLTDFSTDSVRRFLGGYLPAKIRPQLEGDEKLAPVASFDTVVNKWALLERRINEGHAQRPPLETFAPQFRLMIEGARKIYGRELIDPLLA